MFDLTKLFSTRRTPQGEPIPGEAQVPNSAGGFAYALSDWGRLERFLILGTEGGTFYIRPRQLGLECAQATHRCVLEDGPRVVELVAEISTSGRAARQDPALFTLALCAGAEDAATRRAALEALPRVARTGGHLLRFVHFVEAFRGWGRGLRRAVRSWYLRRDADRLAYQVLKYQRRDGWAQRDLLRLAKPRPADSACDAVLRWATRGEVGADAPALLQGHAALATADSARAAAAVIREHRLPREAVPSQWLRHREVWDALLEAMPTTAMIRNLGVMTKVGLIAPGAEATQLVARRLADRDRLRLARVHPLQVLAALATYRAGHSARGHSTWDPVGPVLDALDAAFYATFQDAPRAGRRFLLALDVSGSMCAPLAGIPGLSARAGAAAMALTTMAREPSTTTVGFCDQLEVLDISPRQRLDDVVRALDRRDFGATDCARPILWATERGLEVDVFVVYTDSETWCGRMHPSQALREYRRRLVPGARMVVVGMTSNGFSVADPRDPGMLDVVGFDAAAPAAITAFASA